MNSAARIIVAASSTGLSADMASIITAEDKMRRIELARITSGDTDICAAIIMCGDRFADILRIFYGRSSSYYY